MCSSNKISDKNILVIFTLESILNVPIDPESVLFNKNVVQLQKKPFLMKV